MADGLVLLIVAIGFVVIFQFPEPLIRFSIAGASLIAVMGSIEFRTWSTKRSVSNGRPRRSVSAPDWLILGGVSMIVLNLGWKIFVAAA
ncbi:MAG: hypothetical protein R3F35_11660 [Myxococcota bacterium]